MRPKNSFLQIITAIISVQMTFLPVSFALKIQLKTNVKLREHSDDTMERVGLLTSGTIVEIPDEYVITTNGKPNLDLTLNNWLKKAGEMRSNDGAGRYTFDGDKTEMFFPIKVKQTAPGSTIRAGHEGNQHYVALKYLALRKAAMIVSDDAAVLTSTRATQPKSETRAETVRSSRPKATVDVETQMEATLPCATGVCSKPSDTSAPVRKLISAIAPALANVDATSKRTMKGKSNLDAIRRNFKETCGFSLDSFMPVVKARAEKAGVPADLVMGLMTQESAGRCFSLNSEKDSSQSLGLFQINSSNLKSLGYPRCTTEQKNILKTLGTPTRLASGPRCIENPLFNLDASLNLLKGMKNTLERSGVDENNFEGKDFWRLVASSYNGGPRWVLNAISDLRAFNARNGTQLSPHKWEDLRLFYMRAWLDRDERVTMLGSSNAGRSKSNSVDNLVYAENVLGRPVLAALRPGHAAAWTTALNQ